MATTYLTDAMGNQLALSGASTHGVSGTTAADNLLGTTANDSFRGNGGGDSLSGGAGDDTYNVYDIHDLVIENAGAGVDTVVSSVSYTLSANVENLTVGYDKYAGGNALGNILTGGAGANTLDGKGGNDILTGGAGADIFVMQSGGGHDLVTDFQNSLDRVRLDGSGLTSFSQVRADLVQQGTDVSLNLPTGESILFKNHAVTDFTASDFMLSADTSKMTMTFDDEFNTLSLNTGVHSGTWKTSFGGGAVSGRTLASNQEKEIYADADYTGTGTTPLGVNPFSLNNGVVDITAAPASAAVSAAIGGYQYTSGLMTTRSSFAQQYGYFEVRAKLPAGQGLWPAFWLLPANGSWPPEIDVFEQLGKDPSTIFETSHSRTTGAHTWQQQAINLDNPGGFHTYGMQWDQDSLVWYIDGVEVGRQATSPDMNQPMYMLLNLAVGGGWPGDPDPTTPFPATMSIDYVHAYALNGGGTSFTVTPPTANADSYSTAQDTVLKVAVASGVLANDSDPYHYAMTVLLTSSPTHGAVKLAADGSFVYTPGAGYSGADSFTYKAYDGSQQSAAVTVNLTVGTGSSGGGGGGGPTNHAPVASPDSVSVAAGGSVSISAATLLANATDADGDPLTVTGAAGEGSTHGTVTFSAGVASYTPAAGYTGADHFLYYVSDGKVTTPVAGTVNVTVTAAANAAPVAAGDAYTTSEDHALTVTSPGVLANDSGANGAALTAQLLAGPSHGTVQMAANGSFTYTPVANYNGLDSFTYKASAGSLQSASTTVSLTVTAVNDPPVTSPDAMTATSGVAQTISAATLLANDKDADGDPLTVTGVTMSANPHGSVSLAGGVVTYTPKAGYVGGDSFVYSVSDGHVTTPGTVSVTVNAAPTAIKSLTGTKNTDTFPVHMSDFNVQATGVQLAIKPFGGAGGNTTAKDNDFLWMSGFSHGSTVLWNHDSPTDSHLGYYNVHDALSNHDFLMTIYSTDGKHVTAADFGFL